MRLRHKAVMAVWVGASARMPISGLDQVPELEELGVVVDGLLVLQAAPDAVAGLQVEIFSVTLNSRALQPWPKPATRIRSPGLAVSRAVVSISRGWAVPVSPQTSCRLSATFSGAGPQHRGDFAVLGLEEAGEHQSVDVVHGDIQFVQQPVDGFGDDLGIALVAGPALFPHVVDTVCRRPGSGPRNHRRPSGCP